MFQKFKFEFKQCLQEEIFYGATEITKADFFAIFLVFSAKMFTEKLCKSIFKKTGLILFWPEVVLDKMKEYSGIQEEIRVESSDDESNGFVTPLLLVWSE